MPSPRTISARSLGAFWEISKPQYSSSRLHSHSIRPGPRRFLSAAASAAAGNQQKRHQKQHCAHRKNRGDQDPRSQRRRADAQQAASAAPVSTVHVPRLLSSDPVYTHGAVPCASFDHAGRVFPARLLFPRDHDIVFLNLKSGNPSRGSRSKTLAQRPAGEPRPLQTTWSPGHAA